MCSGASASGLLSRVGPREVPWWIGLGEDGTLSKAELLPPFLTPVRGICRHKVKLLYASAFKGWRRVARNVLEYVQR
jgi:hypothetical protein